MNQKSKNALVTGASKGVGRGIAIGLAKDGWNVGVNYYNDRAGTVWFSDYGVQLSRGFRALKIWLSMKAHGIDKFSRLIQQNVHQARHLAKLVHQTHNLENMAPVSLNIVCFRFNPGDLDEKALNELNKELLLQMHEGGVAVTSYTTLNGKYALRACFINHRTRLEDIDILVEEVLRLGKSLLP